MPSKRQLQCPQGHCCGRSATEPFPAAYCKRCMVDATGFSERRACTGRTFFSADQWEELALLPALQRGRSTFSCHWHASPLPWHLWGSEGAIALARCPVLALCHPSFVARSAFFSVMKNAMPQWMRLLGRAATLNSTSGWRKLLKGPAAVGLKWFRVQLERGARPALTEGRPSRPAGLVTGARRLTSVLDEDGVELGQPALAARVAAV